MNKENDNIQMSDSSSSSSNSNSSSSNKRVKFDHDIDLFKDTPLIAPCIPIVSDTTTVEYCHANDIISLVYLSSIDDEYKLYQPTYTHQLFEVLPFILLLPL